MLFALLAMIAAALFGIVSFGVYGADGLAQAAWVDYVFWGLIGAGAGLALLDGLVRCKVCDLSPRLARSSAFCQTARCC
jgi:hypothetical protein